MRLNRNGCLKLKGKMLKKLRDWMTWIFTKESKKREESCEDVSYFDTKHFRNDLENPEDYYLKVVRNGKNEFVRKDEVDDN